MSRIEIVTKIETILSDILSDKHDAKITIKFLNNEEMIRDGDDDTSRTIREKQVLGK